MLSDPFRIVIRDNFISRLWNWTAGYGILLVAAGLILLFEQSGMENPFRYFLVPRYMHTASLVTYFGAVASVAAGFLFHRRMNSDKLERLADEASLNPSLPFEAEELSEAEQRAVIILRRISQVEGLEWNAASWPGMLGIFYYVLGGSSTWLLICMAISLVAFLFYRPSLDWTEELLESYVRRKSPLFSGKEP